MEVPIETMVRPMIRCDTPSREATAMDTVYQPVGAFDE